MTCSVEKYWERKVGKIARKLFRMKDVCDCRGLIYIYSNGKWYWEPRKTEEYVVIIGTDDIVNAENVEEVEKLILENTIWDVLYEN